MICPFCLSLSTDVFNSRPTKHKNQVWRRRRCPECDHSFTTYERVDLSFLRIESESEHAKGTKTAKASSHPYQRARLYQSILESFEGDRERLRYVDDCLDTIEAKLTRQPDTIISNKTLANLVLQTLRSVDLAAALRFLAKHEQLSSKSVLRRSLRQI